MSAADAFAAVALAAVCWDGVLTMAGSRSLRHALDYRLPFRDFDEAQMLHLLDTLLKQLRDKGAQHLMVDGAAVLNAKQRGSAFAVAAEIMRSDGPLQEDEQNILVNLASVLELDSTLTTDILNVMDVLHSDIQDSDL
ncbi:MAG: tellurite resistance TerB family protein [Synechococcus sp.]|nr:tellurite resistance TerB family protein [Synechococcus sp.]